MSRIMELDREYIAGTYKRYPVCLVEGRGSLVYDENGKRYIDMGSGIGVNIFGAADEKWQEAVNAQAARLQHMSNLYYTEPCAAAAELLCKKSGMKKVFFCNSGAEANEGAIKAARKYAHDKKGIDCPVIMTLSGSFHGRTLATLTATGQDEMHKNFGPMMPGFIYCNPNDSEELKEKAEEVNLAAVMIECIQGEGGVRDLDLGFVKCISDICKEKDILLIVDEVQSGNGRTGYMYSYMGYGIEPDIVTTAKGLAGGLPIGAVMLGEKTADVFGAGDHGSTFGGNPISCAAACSILERIDDELLLSVREKSRYLFDTLKGASGIEEVSGMGLMIGLSTSKPADEVVSECMDRGVICLTAHGRVRLLPALNIPTELLEEAVGIIKDVCK